VEIWDYANGRVSRFSAIDGSLLDEHRLAMEGRPYAFAHRPGSRELYAQLWYVDIAPGQLSSYADSIARVHPGKSTALPMALPLRVPPPPGRMPGEILHHPQQMWAVLGSGDVVSNLNIHPSYRITTLGGHVQREIRLPLTPRVIDEAERLRVISDAMEFFGPSAARYRDRISDHYPLGVRLVAVGDSIFAIEFMDRRVPQEDEPFEGRIRAWRLVSAGGVYLGSLIFPEGFIASWVEEGLVAGVRSDELGVGTVEIYEIRPPG
jgi:hypothetical protein